MSSISVLCLFALFGCSTGAPVEENEVGVVAGKGKVSDGHLVGIYGKLYQGDILLPRAYFRYSESLQFQTAIENLFQKQGEIKNRAAIPDKTRHWPNGVVPYVIDSTIISKGRPIIERAVQYFAKYTCIRLVQRTSEKDYINFNARGNGCYSNLGKIGGEQTIGLSPECFNEFGAVLHEILHALGFYHEQSREDRDQFITIHWENIINGENANFDIGKGSQTYGTRYDLSSVMHYEAKAFSKNGQYTITPNTGSPSQLGRWDSMSPTDKYEVNAMYGCPNTGTGTGTGTPTISGCADKSSSCSAWATRYPSECDVNPDHMLTNCEKSCQVCGKRVGCYSGTSASVVMSDSSLTPNKCKRMCRERDHRYAGLQGPKCICFTSLNGSKTYDFRCRLKCHGNSKLKCGGTYTLDVYYA